MRPQLRERDLLGSRALTKKRGNLRQRRRRGIYLEELKEATWRSFGVAAHVETYPRSPAGAQVLHPMGDGSSPDPELHESRFRT